MSIETKISRLLKEDYDMYGFSGIGVVEDVPEPELEYDDTVDEDDLVEDINNLLESLDDSMLDEYQLDLKERILSANYSLDQYDDSLMEDNKEAIANYKEKIATAKEALKNIQKSISAEKDPKKKAALNARRSKAVENIHAYTIALKKSMGRKIGHGKKFK